MIHAIEIENFRSFDKAVRIEFTAKPEKAGTHGYSKMLPSGAVVSKLAVFVGANASGKSNVLKAITLLGWLITDSAEKNRDSHEYIVPFANDRSTLTTLAVEFCDGREELFRYEVTLNKTLRFSREKLTVRPSPRAQYHTLFDRSLNKRGEFEFNNTEDADWKNIPQRPNASLVGSMILSGKRPDSESTAYNIAQRIYKYAKNGLNKIAPEFDDGITLPWARIGELWHENITLVKAISEFIQQADVGATAIGTQEFQSVDKNTGTTRTVHFPVIEHNIGDKKIFLHFRLESSGTRKVLHLLSEAYPVAQASGILILDEIEEGIHPHLLPKLVETLVATGAASQTILATHSDYLLRHIEHDQAYITEKNDKGATDVYRASDVEEFKADRNLQNWYHAGKLGGIPRL